MLGSASSAMRRRNGATLLLSRRWDQLQLSRDSFLNLRHNYTVLRLDNLINRRKRLLLHPRPSLVRTFASNDFKSVLNKMKKDLENEQADPSAVRTNDNVDKHQATTTNTSETASDAGDKVEEATTTIDESKDPLNRDAANDSTLNDNSNSSNRFNFKIPEVDPSAILSWSKDAFHNFRENVDLAYAEMMGEVKETTLKRKVQQASSFRRAAPTDADEDEEDAMKAYDGPSALVMVDQPKSAWEQMKVRLQDSPFIKEVMKNSQQIGKAAAETDLGKKAQNIGRNVNDKIEDAREFWETSQNPLVYTISGVWENITGQTEEGNVIQELRKLDPQFDKEKWVAEVRENLAPTVLKAHLLGDTKSLRPWLGEAAYNKLAADIRARKHDGISFDTNVLDMDETQVMMKFTDSGAPAVIITYMVQQINCIRNRKGEIIEGGETEIRAKFYVMAFQQDYDEDTGFVEWKVVDYLLAGDIPYY